MADNVIYYGDNPTELLGGRHIEYPPSRQVDGTFQEAPKTRKVAAIIPELSWQ
jgi:hypothetical protein